MFSSPEEEAAAKVVVQAFNDFNAAKDLPTIVNTFKSFLQTANITTPTKTPKDLYDQIKQKLTATHFYGPNAFLKLLDAKWDDEVYKVKEKKRDIKPVVVGGGKLFPPSLFSPLCIYYLLL